MSVTLKKLAYKYEYLKLELQEFEDKIEEFKPMWIDKFGPYLSTMGEDTVKEITEPVKSRKKAPPNRLKKLYRKIATILHPDKGGKEDDFTDFKSAYNEGNFIEMIQSAARYEMEVDLEPEDIQYFEESCSLLQAKIDSAKGSLIYNFFTGDDTTKRICIAKIGQHYGVDIPEKDINKLLS